MRPIAADRGRRPSAVASSPRSRSSRTETRDDRSEAVIRLYIGAGRQAGVRPGDLVGAITGEAGITSRDLGALEIADRYALVEVRESRADDVIEALRGSASRGKKVTVAASGMRCVDQENRARRYGAVALAERPVRPYY
jgi:ATP-dependent RNA helicase DeaD